MEIIKNGIYLISFLVLAYSCDCIQHAQGYVVDFSTLLPIDSVKVYRFYETSEVYKLNDNNFTDSLGRFDFTAISVGFFTCPKLKLYFVKQGYDIYDKKYHSCCRDNDTIKLKRID